MGGLSLEDRFRFGNLPITETRRLADTSHSQFYEDVKLGKVAYQIRGRKSVVPGPIAKRYIRGEPIDDLIPLFPGLVVGKVTPSREAREAPTKVAAIARNSHPSIMEAR